MDRTDDGYDAELARWLEDSGPRRAINLKEPPEALLGYIEELAGRRLASRQDIFNYFAEHKSNAIARDSAHTRRRVLREVVFLSALCVAGAQYYFWDVALQITAMQKVYFFVAPIATATAL